MFLALWASVAHASKIILKISAVNPIEKAQKKEVRSNLPPGAGTNAIINLDGMELRYDLKQDLYYVYRLVDLAFPKNASVLRFLRPLETHQWRYQQMKYP